MKQHLILALLLFRVGLSVLAKDGSFLQTGSVSVTESDNGGGVSSATSSSTTTNLFDKHFNLIETVTLWYFSGSETPSEAKINRLFYDQRGHLVSSIEDLDANADGKVDRRSIGIYTNFLGNPRHLLVLADNDGDGTIDEISTSTYTFDNNGRLISLVTEIDTNADGAADVQTISTWIYDFGQRRLVYTNESDLYSPGLLTVVSTATYALNDEGDPVSGAWSRYDPNVGSQIGGTVTFAYDKFENMVQQVERALFPGPSGPSVATTTSTFFYSQRGKVTRE